MMHLDIVGASLLILIDAAAREDEKLHKAINDLSSSSVELMVSIVSTMSIEKVKSFIEFLPVEQRTRIAKSMMFAAAKIMEEGWRPKDKSDKIAFLILLTARVLELEGLLPLSY